MTPPSNFGAGTPSSGGDPYNWHGTDYTDTNYNSQGNGNPTGPGDWFNDDLMWASIAFARAYQITGTSGWLQAAEEQVDYVWANAQAQTNAADGGTDGTVVGLLQSFCNKNNGKDGDCSTTSPWAPNLDAEVNFTFVIAADLLANNTTVKSTHYQNARNAVYAWAIANLYTETSPQAIACTERSGVTCAEIYDTNNTATFNGEHGYWSGYTVPISPPSASASSNPSSWDFTMNYGNAIQAAVRMGDYQKAQRIANYLMYGLSNPRHPYAGVYQWDANTAYCILPHYGPADNGPATMIDNCAVATNNVTYDEGDNYAGSNGIALRGVAYGLFRNALDTTTKNWAQANVQAAWNNKNADNVIWDDWTPSAVTGTKYFPKQGAYVYDSWDCSDAVAGLLTVPHP
jgi:hypothetical protein